ncbi:MAG: hypothetical protein DRJ56_05425 [Thermoprotei archaeon]|nr:MAG: hypothetical protein DRJ56_05425 [Thermoprotei archaeon]
MRLDLAALGIAGALAVTALLHSYAHALALMSNRNLEAWHLAEEAADQWLATGNATVEGARVVVTDLSTGEAEEYGSCAKAIGYAYTFRLRGGSLYKVEVWLCRP